MARMNFVDAYDAGNCNDITRYPSQAGSCKRARPDHSSQGYDRKDDCNDSLFHTLSFIFAKGGGFEPPLLTSKSSIQLSYPFECSPRRWRAI